MTAVAALFALSLAAFLVLGFHVRGGGPLSWDTDTRSWLARHALWGENDVPADWSGRVGAVVALGVLAYLVHRRRTREAVFWVVGIGGAAVVALGIKHLFERPSPDGVPLSYPSGHAFLSMVLVTLAVALPWGARGRALALALGLAALIVLGVAIVKLHWHYASDVVGGWCLGLAWALGVVLVLRRFGLSGTSRPAGGRGEGPARSRAGRR